MRWRVPEAVGSDKAAATALAAKLEVMLELGATSVEAPAAPPAPERAVMPAPTHTAGDAAANSEPPGKVLPATPAAPPAGIAPSREEDTGATDAATTGGTMKKPAPLVPGPAPVRLPARKPVEPRLFVSPRAPDDPGTETPDLDDL